MQAWLQEQWKRIKLYHKYYRISGLYKFVFRNALKVVSVILIILLAFLFIEKYIIDFDVIFNRMVEKFSWYSVIIIFFISETFLGLIPPDLFIIWSELFPHKYLVLTYLALLSFLGGIISYKIGRLLYLVPSVERFVNIRFRDNFVLIKKWGGVVIVIAALFPLPFSTVSMVAGVMRFPAKMFYLFGSTRILRFYIYAVFLYKVLFIM